MISLLLRMQKPPTFIFPKHYVPSPLSTMCIFDVISDSSVVNFCKNQKVHLFGSVHLVKGLKMHLSEIEFFLQGREFVVYCAEAVQIKTIISQQRSDTGLLDEIKLYNQ